MDFMRLLKSIEELLYELVSWLLFYPLTMWRTLHQPQAMMRYADLELTDDVSEQYTETLSPPLFLLITLMLAHGVELGLVNQTTPWAPPPLLANDSNLLMFRAVAFSILPLLMAVKLLRHKGARLTRDTLRAPFFSQCYVTSPFALALSVGMLLTRTDNQTARVTGLACVLAAFAWYVIVETRWFKADLGLSTTGAVLRVVWTLVQALIAILLVGAAIVYGTGSPPA
ncbi:permease [Ensifer sp. HO-A22]|uniref:Permease n=1 Tax=Ensifer oleiphilus TaxID=2742698 RepID=A0A7Y6Q4B3_9HYPH|nr:permease [Ensifer oleiphilus]NVD38765.1 permease [Ensifer oleiphilus]